MTSLLQNTRLSLNQTFKPLPASPLHTRGFVRTQCRPARVHRPGVRAGMDIGLLLAAVAEDAVKPGSVDAPIGVIIGAAVVVTAALTFAIPAALKPGDEAAKQIFNRDAKSGRKR